MNISINNTNFVIDVMTLVLLFVIFLLLILLYRAQRDIENFDLKDLITEKEHGELKVSLSRFGQLTALIVSTWGFITLTSNDKLTEWYYTSYMMVWAAAEGFRKWNTQKKNDEIKRENKYNEDKVES